MDWLKNQILAALSGDRKVSRQMLLALAAVVAQNGYGHPGKGLLEILRQSGAQVLRTDLLGAISVGLSQNALSWSATGR
jgi:beta-lactamase superfamily II metal-dependent hydrolase